MSNSTRKPREDNGPYFQWNAQSNMLAYCCYRVVKDNDSKEKVAGKLGIDLKKLNNRIQHFNSLSPDSKSTTSTPSLQVKDIYHTSAHISDNECETFIQNFLNQEIFNRSCDKTTTPKAISNNFVNEEVDTIEEDEVIDFEIQKVNEIDDLNSIYKQFWTMQRNFQKLEMNDMPWNDFLKVVSTMNIKSRGMKIEKRILQNNKEIFRKSVMSEQGDAWLANGDGVEIKTSFITPLIGSSVSLTGLRLWELEVKHYLLLVVDIRDLEKDPLTYALWLSKEDLEKMNEKGDLSTPGMKKTAAKNNLNIPKALNFPIRDLSHWLNKYPCPSWLKL